MFSPNEQLRLAVKAVVDFAAHLSRGDILKIKDIERLAKCDRDSGRWKSVIEKMRRVILRDRGIALRPINNVGYRFCEPDEQLKYCSRNRQRRAIRQLNRGVREIGSLPTEELNLHQQQVRALMLGQLVSERKHVKRGVRDQQSEIRKTETMPRPQAVAS